MDEANNYMAYLTIKGAKSTESSDETGVYLIFTYDGDQLIMYFGSNQNIVRIGTYK